jgi:hypothetical protein
MAGVPGQRERGEFPAVRKRDWAGRRRADNVRDAVKPREEVRPMNAVQKWVLPFALTVGD